MHDLKVIMRFLKLLLIKHVFVVLMVVGSLENNEMVALLAHRCKTVNVICCVIG